MITMYSLNYDIFLERKRIGANNKIVDATLVRKSLSKYK